MLIGKPVVFLDSPIHVPGVLLPVRVESEGPLGLPIHGVIRFLILLRVWIAPEEISNFLSKVSCGPFPTLTIALLFPAPGFDDGSARTHGVSIDGWFPVKVEGSRAPTPVCVC